MKIKISYLPGEKLMASVVKASMEKLLPHCKVSTFQKHPPFTHIYITTPKPKQD